MIRYPLKMWNRRTGGIQFAFDSTDERNMLAGEFALELPEQQVAAPTVLAVTDNGPPPAGTVSDGAAPVTKRGPGRPRKVIA